MKDLVLRSVVAYVECVDYLISKVSERVAMLGRMRKTIKCTRQVPFINLLFSLFLITAILCATAAGVLSLKVAEAHSMYRDASGQQRKSAKVLRLRNLGKKTREP